MAFYERNPENLVNLIARFVAYDAGALENTPDYQPIFAGLTACHSALTSADDFNKAAFNKQLHTLRSALVKKFRTLPEQNPLRHLIFDALNLLALYWPLNQVNEEGHYLDYFNQDEVIAYTLNDNKLAADQALIATVSGYLIKQSDIEHFYTLGKAYRLRDDVLYPISMLNNKIFLDRLEAAALIQKGVTIFKPSAEMQVNAGSSVAINKVTPELERAVSNAIVFQYAIKGFNLAGVLVGIPSIIALFALSLFIAPPISPLLICTLLGTALATAGLSRKESFWRDCFESLATSWIMVILISVTIPHFFPALLTSTLLTTVASSFATNVTSLIAAATPIAFLALSGIVDGVLGRFPGVTLHRDIFEFCASLIMSLTGIIGASFGSITAVIYNLTRAPLSAPEIATVDDFAAKPFDILAEGKQIQTNMASIQKRLNIKETTLPFNPAETDDANVNVAMEEETLPITNAILPNAEINQPLAQADIEVENSEEEFIPIATIKLGQP